MTVDDTFVYFKGVVPHAACDDPAHVYRTPRAGGAPEELFALPDVSNGKLAIDGDHLLVGPILSSADGTQRTSLDSVDVDVEAVEIRAGVAYFADAPTGAMYRVPL